MREAALLRGVAVCLAVGSATAPAARAADRRS